MKKNFLFLFSLVVSFSFSQKNVSKAVLFPESFYKVAGVAQERVLSGRISAQTTFRLLGDRHFADAKYAGGSYRNDLYNPFTDTRVSAFGNVTELRLYGKKKGALRGFYWGPYGSFNSCKITTGVYNSCFRYNGSEYHASLKQEYQLKSLGGGLQFGVQTVVKNKFVIDWTILGIGFGNLILKGKIKVIDGPATLDLRELPSDPRNTEFAFEKYHPIKKSIEAKSISISGKAPVPFLRMSLAIGICY